MFRKVLVGVVRHGRKVFDGIIQRGERGVQNGQKPRDVIHSEAGRSSRFVGKRPVIFRISDGNRGYLAQQIARYARKNLASELRKQFDKSPIYREYSGLASKLSMFAFVGVGFASYGNQREENYSSVCNHIQNLLKSIPSAEDQPINLTDQGLHNFTLGPIIAKGCNAAVYKARYVHEQSMETEESESSSDNDSSVVLLEDDATHDFELIENICDNKLEDSDLHKFDLFDLTGSSDMEFDMCDSTESSDIEVIEVDEEETQLMTDFNFSCQGPDTYEAQQVPRKSTAPLDSDFDLAIKMMFNYDVESKADTILREMQKELLPVRDFSASEFLGNWENGHRAKEKKLPPHPNIVQMPGAFVDEVPCLPEGRDLYPDALPIKYNPDGSGRNRTLFLIMKRYPMTLREYLEKNPSLPRHHSVMLLAQLLEAVAHLNAHGIAHRDLKSDNIFVDVVDGGCPRLVVSDFGDCLHVGEQESLLLPYYTDEISRGGNGALMAPEISTASPGPKGVLDFRKSDLWTVGTLAYEIFGENNPFYRTAQGTRLCSRTYREEDLPALPSDIPPAVRKIVNMLLCRHPSQRPTATEAATMLQTILWSPVEWSLTLPQRSRSLPSSTEVIRWLLTLTAQVLIEKGCNVKSIASDLRKQLLARVDFSEVLSAVDRLCTI